MSRLPTPGGDSGNWGTILNDYLTVSINSDGTLKNTVDLTSSQTITGAKTFSNATSFADGLTGTPSLTFTSDTDLGLWRIGANQAGWYGSFAIRGPRPHVDVRAYGALGDGSTDDTANVHAARDLAGVNGTLLFTAGTYLVGGLLANVAGQHWIVMAGATIKLKNAGNTAVIVVTGAGVVISGPGTVDGNRANQTTGGQGIVTSGDNSRVIDVIVTGTYSYGIQVVNASGAQVRGCQVTNTKSIAIFAQADASAVADEANVLITGNSVDRSAEAGISEGGIKVHANSTYALTEARISDNHVILPTNPTDGAAICIEVQGKCDRVQITGNTTSGGSMGISVDTVISGTISGNTAYNAKNNGIELANAKNCTVSGNGIDGNDLTANGIGVVNTAPTSNSIVGNTIRRCPSSGIKLIDADYTTVVGNQITLTAGYGINVISCEYIAITGNMLYGSGTGLKAIILDTSRRLVVSGNSTSNWTQNAVLIYAASVITLDRIAIVGNHFTNSGGGAGTQLSGGAVLGSLVQVQGNPGQSDSRPTDILDLLNNVYVFSGSGTPEAAITAGVGSVFHRRDGGASTCLYVKESGTGNTGWVAK